MTKPTDSPAKVRSYVDTLKLPTYELIGENRNPVFHSQYGVAHIYPYTLQDEIASKPTNRTYRTLNLENEYLRVTVLPELGGRVYAVFDKIVNREVFYKNEVVKFSPLAIRGAFYSGGVEFSFPVAHAPTTADPINWEMINHDDGSVSIALGGHEHISGMRWIVTLTLFPDRCALAQDVRLYNPTPLPGRYHYWTNASLISNDQTEFIYPFRRVRSYEFAGTASWPVARLDLIKGEPGLPGMEGVPMWPGERMHDPVNFRWEKDMLAQVSIFGRNVAWDYFGAWQHASNTGYAHFANAKDVSGMKLWSWGRAEVGIVNQTALTDDGSIYAETQCGAMETQLDFDFLPPGETRSWREWWLPLRDLGGLTCASADVGARLHISPGKNDDQIQLGIAICPATRLEDAQVELAIPGKQLIKESISCSPETPWVQSIGVEAKTLAGSPITLNVTDKAGVTLLDYCHDREPDPVPQEIHSFTDDGDVAEAHFQSGLHHQNFDNRDKAIESFREVISVSDNHGDAHLQLGQILLRGGDFETASAHFDKAAACGVSDAEYYLGQTSIYLGHFERAEEHFETVAKDSAMTSVAMLSSGRLALRREKWDEAIEHIRRAKGDQELAITVSLLKGITLRRSMHEKESWRELSSVLANDPLNHIALRELSLLGDGQSDDYSEKLSRLLIDDPQYHLDLACYYLDCGLMEDALSVLKSANDEWDYAMVRYMAAWITALLGEEADAATWRESAQGAEMDFVFPSRLWEVVALQHNLEHDPKDNKAKFYLGNFFFAHQRYHEAAELWEDASVDLGDYDILHRNMGLYQMEVLEDPLKAIASFEKALKLNPENQDLYILLDNLFRAQKSTSKRVELLSAIEKLDSVREELRKRRLLIMVELGQYEAVLEILEKEEFVPLEMDQSFHTIYVDALLQRADANLEEGNLEKAINDYEQALGFPGNHGVGQPTSANDAEILYRLGCAHEQLGQFDKAIQSWRTAAKENHHYGEPLYVYVQMALDKLGRYSEIGFDVGNTLM